MKRIRAFVRWDLGIEEEENRHQLLYTHRAIEGTRFALHFDRTWEWLALYDFYLHGRDGYYPNSIASEQEFNSLFGKTTACKRWHSRVEGAIWIAELTLKHFRENGVLPWTAVRFAFDWDKERLPSSEANFVKNLEWLVRTQLRERRTHQQMLEGLLDGVARFSYAPPYVKQLPAAVCDALNAQPDGLGDPDGHVYTGVADFVRRCVSQGLYEETRMEMDI